MVFKFRLISDEVKNFVRDIEVLSEQTFFDFHNLLVKDLHYDKTQIASFFITNQNWEKQQEFTLFDMSEESPAASIRMDRAVLKDHIREEQQRLLYIFDFFSERGLFIELIDKGRKLDYTEYPRITFSCGKPPTQILMDDNNLEDMTFDE